MRTLLEIVVETDWYSVFVLPAGSLKRQRKGDVCIMRQDERKVQFGNNVVNLQQFWNYEAETGYTLHAAGKTGRWCWSSKLTDLHYRVSADM